RAMRDRLCAGSGFEESAQEALDLSGGHPWYLSMLGYSVARLSRGQPLTRPLVKRAAARLIEGNIPAGGKINKRSNFYGAIFQSLERLPKRLQAIAQTLLAYLAQRTTAEFPWLSRSHALEPPKIVRQTSEEERHSALVYLERERAVELDPDRNQARVRVPLT